MILRVWLSCLPDLDFPEKKTTKGKNGAVLPTFCIIARLPFLSLQLYSAEIGAVHFKDFLQVLEGVSKNEFPKMPARNV